MDIFVFFMIRKESPTCSGIFLAGKSSEKYGKDLPIHYGLGSLIDGGDGNDPIENHGKDADRHKDCEGTVIDRATEQDTDEVTPVVYAPGRGTKRAFSEVLLSAVTFNLSRSRRIAEALFTVAKRPW